jgi:hypothetical protein
MSQFPDIIALTCLNRKMRPKTTNNHGMAWLREARGSNQDQSRVINIIIYFSKY